MTDQMKADLQQLTGLVASTYQGIALSAGISAGILERLNLETPVSLHTLVVDTGFDMEKLDHWLYFAIQAGFVARKGDGFTLTSKGFLVTSHSPIKELYAMYMLSDFYMKAASESRETFIPKKSLDQLSEGKISRDYQPKVSDNLSAVLLNYFHEHHVKAGDSLLDIGCGNGSFLRLMNQSLPDVSLNGVDSNLFSIELGKKENIRLGLQDRIRLLVGDATADMSDIPANSYDWVTAINLFHFIPAGKRARLVEEMVRIAKKGVFMTEAVIELSPLTASANPLMKLLWNDFTGFFRMEESDELNHSVETKFPKYKIQKVPILQGSTYLVIIQKHE